MLALINRHLVYFLKLATADIKKDVTEGLLARGSVLTK